MLKHSLREYSIISPLHNDRLMSCACRHFCCLPIDFEDVFSHNIVENHIQSTVCVLTAAFSICICAEKRVTYICIILGTLKCIKTQRCVTELLNILNSSCNICYLIGLTYKISFVMNSWFAFQHKWENFPRLLENKQLESNNKLNHCQHILQNI